MAHREDDVIVNALVRQALSSTQEVMGENGLNAVLRASGLDRFIGNFPPNDLAPGIKTADYARLNQAIEDFYGRGGRGMLRRIVCTNWPMPMDAVSPSPLMPRANSSRLASTAPVAIEGMRPCTPLKLCERLMKYAGLFDEQPMPLILMTRSGAKPISYMASMMRSEMALWPQPAHSVVLPPL